MPPAGFDFDDVDYEFIVVDSIDNSPVADSKPVPRMVGQFFHVSHRMRIANEFFYFL